MFITMGIESLLKELIKVGRVSSLSEQSARVVFPDRDDVVSYDLPVLQHGAMRTQGHWMPEVGEQVLCLFLPNGIESGFVLGSFYSDTQPGPDVAEGAVVVAGDSVHLGDADADDPVVRKSDLQAAIDDLKSYTDDAIDNHTHTVSGSSATGGPVTAVTDSTIWSGQPAPNAKASDKVFSS